MKGLEILMNLPDGPALIIEYRDPLEGFGGWLVIDCLDHGLAAGGMRVCPGIRPEHLAAMARNMTLKMRIAEIGLDGAKCGIDYNPAAPGKEAAMSRFLAAIAPYVRTGYSMGPDLNVGMDELSRAADAAGIKSVKMAVAGAMGWEIDYFLARYRILAAGVNGKKLGAVRAGYGVTGAALACLERLGIAPKNATIAVQGAGTLAMGALHGLEKHGVRLVAVADAEKSLRCATGIDIATLLAQPPGILSSFSHRAIKVRPRDEIINADCDLLLPLAIEGVITAANADTVKAGAVVPGANLAVTPRGYETLHRRGILTVPDFLAGAGGSISMEGLFAPSAHPRPGDVLAHVTNRTRELTLEVFNRAAAEGTSPYKAALTICAERKKSKSGYKREQRH